VNKLVLSLALLGCRSPGGPGLALRCLTICVVILVVRCPSGLEGRAGYRYRTEGCSVAGASVWRRVDNARMLNSIFRHARDDVPTTSRRGRGKSESPRLPWSLRHDWLDPHSGRWMGVRSMTCTGRWSGGGRRSAGHLKGLENTLGLFLPLVDVSFGVGPIQSEVGEWVRSARGVDTSGSARLDPRQIGGRCGRTGRGGAGAP
jgi:hypothetical protein